MKTRPAELELYITKPGRGKGTLRWRVVAKNGEKLSNSGEAYARKAKLLGGLLSATRAQVKFLVEQSLWT